MANREARAPNGTDGAHGAGMVALDQRFDRDSLYALRSAVAAHASSLGAPSERVSHLVIIASELASNAIQHGGGQGRLRLWQTNGMLHCEVSDAGPGIADPQGAGGVAPSAFAPNGRGLWIVRRLTAGMKIESSERGATVLATVALS
jgi:anti-sigma regulatory factor (Ser/Thr protein kinase)